MEKEEPEPYSATRPSKAVENAFPPPSVEDLPNKRIVRLTSQPSAGILLGSFWTRFVPSVHAGWSG